MAGALRRARAALEARFWRTSGLARFREEQRKPRKLTPEQVTEIQRAIDDLNSDDYVEEIAKAGEVLLQAGWDSAKTLLQIQTGFDVVPDKAIAQINGMAKQFGFLAVDREKKALRDTLEDALYEGSGIADTAKAIRSTFAEGYHIFDDKGEAIRRTPTAAWSTMVARTELSRASNLGSFSLYHEAGIEKVTWIATEGQNCCDECSAADGETVDIGDMFPFVDVDSPPVHPNCVCSTVPSDDDLGDFTSPDATQYAAAQANNAADEAYDERGE